MDRVIRRLLTFAVFVFVGAVLAGGYSVLRTHVIEDVYRDKLASLAGEYEALRARYNEAVKHTAVTELVVTEGDVDVIVRSVDGVLQRFDTELDPDNEVHIDFVVKDSRLFIRRLYDDETAPAEGQIIDPELAGIDWQDPEIARGLTVYRGQLEPGRWVVSTTGNGALDLVPVGDHADVGLRAAPPIRDFDAIEQDVARDLAHVGPADILDRAVRMVK